MTTTTSSSVDILNKYAGLGDAINDVRTQYETLLEQIQTIQDSQAQLIQQERQMQVATNKARGSLTVWKDKLEKAETDYQAMQRSWHRAQWNKERAQQFLQTLHAQSDAQRQVFLDDSATFRQECQRLRLAAAVLGLEHAAAQAHAMVHPNGDASLFDGLGSAAVVESWRDHEDDLEADPLTWVTQEEEEDDELLREQLERYRIEKDKLSRAQELLVESQTKKQAAQDQVMAKQGRQQQLQGQLDRICKDNAELELQLEELKRETEEAELLAASFEKNARARAAPTKNGSIHTTTASSITPSPNLLRSTVNNDGPNQAMRSKFNPYARNSKLNTAKASLQGATGHSPWLTTTSSSSTTTTSTAPASTSSGGVTNGGAGGTTLLQRQHPHRAGGRIRRDKQFGTGLRVRGGEDSSLTQWSPPSTTRAVGNTSSHTVEDRGGSSEFPPAVLDDATPSLKRAAESSQSSLLDMLFNDDDDDDNLLGFVAFPQAK